MTKRLHPVLLLLFVAGCGKAPVPTPWDLSAYTNIAPGTPILVVDKVELVGDAPKWLRDELTAPTTNRGTLVYITKDSVGVKESATDQVTHYAKTAVSAIYTNSSEP